MKKTLIIALSLLMSTYTFCQTPSSFDREEVVEVKNTKAKLYANAQTWIAKTFGDYKSVIQFEDKEQGRLIIKGLSDLNVEFYPNFKYTITIDVKENKYRYSITEINIGFAGTSNFVSSYSSIEKTLLGLNSVKSKLDNILALSTSSMSKKELKKYEEEVNGLKVGYNSYSSRISNVKDILDTISNSLKTAMKSNDDF
ncbi:MULTISPECIES: DUF4468 domain-containing protein [unclassified Arcicella]|uniref:DUF4468 domain-containing protein n=1 Tax=unclassified Arcicella TaxID=2644986 RepID=UPI002857CF26|nr:MULTISPECIES: DUF4468 domain-containing protein [unclassified Arcicella]MDR6564683.1 hypothetical protein [Arcicella sp. BE51]MDR6814390.1 hypothetical protein [Arcicella sp. BE140]MDR6825856.1 hypothetical protein [Arcicella sp. BE139]